MAHKFSVTIQDANDVKFAGECELLVVPGAGGEMSIAAGHTRLMTPLRKGTVTVNTAADKATEIEIDKGFLWVTKERVHVIL